MASKESMMQAITQAANKAAKAGIIAARERNLCQKCKDSNQAPRARGSVLKQSTFDWKAPGKYHKSNTFETELDTFSLKIITTYKKMRRWQ